MMSAPSPPEPPLLLRAIDRLLGAMPRTTDELRRARVIVGAVCFLLLNLGVVCVHGWLNQLPAEKLFVVALPGVGGALALGLARRRSATTGPAIILCLSLLVSIGWTELHRDGLPAVFLPWHSCMVLFAVYLGGHRAASFLFLVASLVQIVGAYVLHRLGLVLDGSAFPLDPTPVFVGAAVTGAIITWSLGWGYSRAADAAHLELSRAMATLHESRANLASLVDNTDDLICSLDRDLDLVTLNASFRSWSLSALGSEARIGAPLLAPGAPAEAHELWTARRDAVLRGERIRAEQVLLEGERRRTFEFLLNPILGPGGEVIGITFFGRDITARREAEEKTAQVQRQLLEVSRRAGMAEVATSVLHNVGNVLNSVNVSASLVMDLMQQSKVAGLAKVVELLRQHEADLAGFFQRDARAQRLPDYLAALGAASEREREQMAAELESMQKNIDHIKTIVSMQRPYARAGGVIERLSLKELLEDCLRLDTLAHEQREIAIAGEYAALPLVEIDRHKVRQIVSGLLENARRAVAGLAGGQRIALRLRLDPPGWIVIDVADTGRGVAAEDMTRVFGHDFTAKPDGQGLRLHSCALSAREMGGSLTCSSDGPGRGATFTLALPFQSAE